MSADVMCLRCREAMQVTLKVRCSDVQDEGHVTDRDNRALLTRPTLLILYEGGILTDSNMLDRFFSKECGRRVHMSFTPGCMKLTNHAEKHRTETAQSTLQDQSVL